MLAKTDRQEQVAQAFLGTALRSLIKFIPHIPEAISFIREIFKREQPKKEKGQLVYRAASRGYDVYVSDGRPTKIRQPKSAPRPKPVPVQACEPGPDAITLSVGIVNAPLLGAPELTAEDMSKIPDLIMAINNDLENFERPMP